MGLHEVKPGIHGPKPGKITILSLIPVSEIVTYKRVFFKFFKGEVAFFKEPALRG